MFFGWSPATLPRATGCWKVLAWATRCELTNTTAEHGTFNLPTAPGSLPGPGSPHATDSSKNGDWCMCKLYFTIIPKPEMRDPQAKNQHKAFTVMSWLYVPQANLAVHTADA